MGFLDAFGQSSPKPAPEAPAASQLPDESRVPEVTAADLLVERRDSCPPLLLDCREDYEWQQRRIPGSMHIPMRQIPRRLAELDAHADIVVVCAHGERSYGMTAYLVKHGYSARSLRGGLVEWQAQGGPLENGHGQ